ncbi:MAG TPA: LuxR C-terminal-related transcriptional regulator [Oryzihumus sp.]|nr:LuxR C-terminal-related transcriptional regulator [Oryzihumus sp.]
MPDQSNTALARPRPPGAGVPVRLPAAADFLMLTTMYSPPRLPRRPVMRDRLTAQLTEAVRDSPLTLVSAPAGSGKTTLAATWLDDPGVPWRVVWLTLSEATGSPEEFWFFVIEALSRAGVDLPHTTSLPGLPQDYDALVTQLATDLLNRAEPVVLVLDEVERLGDARVPHQLDLLLRLASVRIRLVLLSRVDPLLPMQRYRLTGTMSQIRMADLAFTREEARELLSGSGIDLTEPMVMALYDRTKGWAAGLQLAALAREHRPDSDPEAGDWLLGAQDANLAEYLTGEILAAQPPQLRDFLLRTSIIDPVCAELAEVLTGDVGAAMSLMTLSHQNILVEAAGDLPGCYHAHPLFRELLRAQLAYESPQLLPGLHERAGLWFADAGMVDQALAHLASAGCWQEVAHLVVRRGLVGDLLRPSSGWLLQRVAGMPAGTPGAEAAVVRAAAALGRGDLPACDDALGAATEQANEDGHLGVALATTRLAAAASHADPEGAGVWADRLEQAWAGIADGDDPAPMPADLRARLLSTRALAQLHRGDLTAATATLGRAVGACVEGGLGAEHVANLGRRALVEAVLGRLKYARELVDTTDRLVEEQSVAEEGAPALAMAAAWVQVEAGAAEAALSMLPESTESAEPLERVVLQVLGGVVRSRALRALGRPEAVGDLPELQDVPTGWLGDLLAQERVAALLTAGDPVGAQREAARAATGVRGTLLRTRAALAGGDGSSVTSLDPATVEHTDELPVDLQVEAWLVQAQARLAAGSREPAVAAVRRAVRRARSEGLRRPFREAPPEVRRLWASQGTVADAARWLAEGAVPARPVAAAARRPAAHHGTPRPLPARAPVPAEGRRGGAEEPIIVEALSARETEVLRHLADLLTTEEVAEAMFVSVNTVKSHIRSILRKLSVARRNEAIRRARELNVI